MRRGDDLGRILELGGEGVDFSALRGDGLGEDGLDDRLLGLEVVVEGTEADVGLVGDLLDAGAVDPLASGPEDVVLALVEGAVADPDRTRAAVAGQLLAHRFGQIPATVDPVHDLQSAVVVAFEVSDELHELVGFPIE
jgi:hypothetical protein